MTAYELVKLGYRVEVLERDTRIGGRIRTHRFGTGPGAPSVELGAMRIPAHHRHTLAYIDHLRLRGRLRAFTPLLADENTFLQSDSGFVRVREAAAALREGFLGQLAHRRHDYSEETIAFGIWLTTVVNAIAPPDLRDELRADLRSQLLDLVERIDLTRYVHGEAKDRVDLHGLFADHPGIRAVCSGRLNSFLDDILIETDPSLLRLKGGMDQLSQRLAARLKGRVACGRRVMGIDVRPDDVLVHVRTGTGTTVVKRADYAVCTVPFPALSGMRVSGLDPDKTAVVRDVVYCPATKVAFHCREPFWQSSGISGGASYTGGSIRQTYYPSVDGDPARGAALLASYTIGHDADVLGRLPAPQRHRAVLEELGAIHPELLHPGMVLDVVSAVWGNSPWSGNGCTTRWGKDAAACETERLRAARPVGRLFFAGEHCSTAPAWIEGAIESALRAVEDVLRHEPVRRPAAAGVPTPARALR